LKLFYFVNSREEPVKYDVALARFSIPTTSIFMRLIFVCVCIRQATGPTRRFGSTDKTGEYCSYLGQYSYIIQ